MERGKKFSKFAKRSFIYIIVFLVMVFTGNASQRFISAAGESESTALSVKNSYFAYLEEHKDKGFPQEELTIPIENFTTSEMAVEIVNDFEGAEGKCIKTKEEGYIEWSFDVKNEGLYNIYVEYYPLEGRSSAIEREVWINGKLPFSEARHFLFDRVWVDADDIKKDNRGNEIRPMQVEKPMWQSLLLDDYLGYHSEPYKFFFKRGSNSLRLISIKEPMAIRSIKLVQSSSIPKYESIKQEYSQKGYKSASNQLIKVQGENTLYKSDPTMYPVSDRSSPATEPYDISKIRLNTIGGLKWNQTGQWLTWEFEVEQDGLYQIALKARQNVIRGSYVNRKLYIDGKVPFDEMNRIRFYYSPGWKMDVLGDKEPYMFYLEKGKHQLKLEVTLGDMAEIIREAEDSVYELNNAYRKILMITGAVPDTYRDYQLEKRIPETILSLKNEGKKLERLTEKLRQATGERGSNQVILDKLALQLNDLVKDPETIPSRLNNFKGNVGALSTWILTTCEQPLEIDYLIIADPNHAMPKAEVNFIQKFVHEVMSFFTSFIADYDSVGNISEEPDALKVWIATGRDQAQVLKQMVDDSFKVKTGIPANLELVQSGVLLPAIVAGTGPDVVIQVGASEPINYAFRGAVTDLAKYPDYTEVAKRFHESAITPYKFRDSVYALPEQQVFPMLFYRKDILEEMGLKVPDTWEDLYKIIPEIQKNNMNLGLPFSQISTSGEGLRTFAMLLYQRGGTLYKKDGISSNLDSEISIETFNKWTEFYSSYKLPLQFDMVNRFRTGEIPICIADYSLYNMLSISAPEIRGLWEFAPVPGMENEGNIVDRSVPGSGTACIILDKAKNKDNAWEFVKWWTDKEAQIRFAREIESLMGPAARYPTANIEALEQIAWPAKDIKSLKAQWKWVKGIPEVPGGYFTPRHLDNAFRAVVYKGNDERETLLDYTRVINEEIKAKRREFGLDK